MKVLHRYKLPFTPTFTGLLLAGILFIAAFLRLYHIADYLTFLGDEGRDVLVVKGILEGNLVFLGPRASSGDFFLGPIYYYFMAPFLWAWNFNPVGPAIMIAILGVITVYFVYRMAREFFGVSAGLIASFLYAVSTLVVLYSKSSWNPNAVPFFTILLMYFLYKAVKFHSLKYYLVVGILYGILMQLHYIIVFLGVIIGLFILLGNFLPIPKKKEIITRMVQIVKGGGITLLGFLIGLSPFLAFELKNGFPNIRTILQFVPANTVGGETSGPSFFWIVSDVYLRVFGRLLTALPSTLPNALESGPLSFWIWVICLTSLISLIALYKVKNTLFVLLLFFWTIIGIVLFGFYKKPIYDYYFAFLFPVPFLLIGNLLGSIYDSKKAGILGKIFVVLLVFVLVRMNLMTSHLTSQPNRQLMQMQNVAEFILSKTSPGPYNFALVTGGNSDHAYRYFFSLQKREPVTIENVVVDPNRETVTNQLFVLCEEVPCSPLGHPLHEIASFGRAEIEGEWNLSVDHGRVFETPPGEKPFLQVYKMKKYTPKEGEDSQQ